MRFWLLSVFVPLLAVGGARQDKWEIVGPGGGGAMFFPTISPHDSSRVLVRCDMTGSYISEDNGASWREFSLHSTANYYVFDPVDPMVIYVDTIGLWRTTDAGKTWSLVYPDPARVAGVKFAGDHGDESLVMSSGPAANITALAVDPSDSKTLYGVIGNTLRVSTDWGVTWMTSGTLTDGARKIYVDASSPAEDRTLYIIGNKTVTVREGGNWRVGAAPAGVSGFTDASLGFPEGGGPPVIYATADRILISENGGASWSNTADLPGTRAQFKAISTSLLHGDSVYVSYSNLTQPDGTYYFGVSRSNDRGKSWTVNYRAANGGSPGVRDAWVTDALGAGFGGNPGGLGVAPGNPEICYGSDDGRVFRTLDGGQTWTAVYAVRTGDGGYSTTGLDVTTNYGVHFDPFDVNRMFITYTDIGLFRSETGGQSWVYSAAGVPRGWRNTTYWVEFDPAVQGRMWSAVSGTHDLPRPKMWRRTDPVKFTGGVCVSDDGGKTWRVSNDGMLPSAITHVLLDPGSPPDARVLYATAFGRGVYKSLDGGRTWALKNNGIEGAQPFAWRMVRDANAVLYLVVARRSDNGSIGDASDGALYRSTDGAESWIKMSLPEGTNGPNGLAVDGERLYLAAWGRFQNTGDVGGGVFVSTDAGATWVNTLSADQHIYDVTLANGILYAAGFESSAWRSNDSGVTWSRLRGYNFKWGHRVIADPVDASKIYITTFGSSVWHGPAIGDVDAPEDIAGPAAVMFGKP